MLDSLSPTGATTDEPSSRDDTVTSDSAFNEFNEPKDQLEESLPDDDEDDNKLRLVAKFMTTFSL